MSTLPKPKNSVKCIRVPQNALPLCCPPKNTTWLDAPDWAMHPRVYLPLEEKKAVVCPYCGTQYELDEAH